MSNTDPSVAQSRPPAKTDDAPSPLPEHPAAARQDQPKDPFRVSTLEVAGPFLQTSTDDHLCRQVSTTAHFLSFIFYRKKLQRNSSGPCVEEQSHHSFVIAIIGMEQALAFVFESTWVYPPKCYDQTSWASASEARRGHTPPDNTGPEKHRPTGNKIT
ncbi:hypothetical protein MGG_10887 [Pyricularia oryzae 70-15]|uniref:Uncharacterized protein n=3 Tax=Pyricularia oryzae TaxID=318829 RepID=G4MQF0_PYRO7|nr:uncharacterized protein MGG_10887 [Pyricularia oryzae 70-15]EHA58136.1 hypothetical protein MGG_10887 [Pyricularia oryzae 70-15]ELQ33848.1 hypothetical protein OOU_Y34scaffold00864g4 [Pyricularia oryzae Y34]